MFNNHLSATANLETYNAMQRRTLLQQASATATAASASGWCPKHTLYHRIYISPARSGSIETESRTRHGATHEDRCHTPLNNPASPRLPVRTCWPSGCLFGEGKLHREAHRRNLHQRLWTVPTNRMKAGAEHKVPLSDWACDILKALRPERYNPRLSCSRAQGAENCRTWRWPCCSAEWVTTTSPCTDFVQPSATGPAGKLISNMKRLRWRWRTASDRSRSAYRRGRALRKRVDLMTAWAEYCGQRKPSAASRMPDAPNPGMEQAELLTCTPL